MASAKGQSMALQPRWWEQYDPRLQKSFRDSVRVGFFPQHTKGLWARDLMDEVPTNE